MGYPKRDPNLGNYPYEDRDKKTCKDILTVEDALVEDVWRNRAVDSSHVPRKAMAQLGEKALAFGGLGFWGVLGLSDDCNCKVTNPHRSS